MSTGLLTFSGVILGLSFVALPMASTMFEKRAKQRYSYKLLNQQMNMISSLGVITIQASVIAFLNIVLYFFRYDVFGAVTVFLEVLILPSFFIIVLTSVYRFWSDVMLSA